MKQQIILRKIAEQGSRPTVDQHAISRQSPFSNLPRVWITITIVMNDEFLCLTLVSLPNEAEATFKTRLVEFWTHMIRNLPDDYEKVYSEARGFESDDDSITRQYMIGIDVWPILEPVLKARKMGHLPMDEDDTYNRAEASSSEWFQIPHD